MSRRVVIFIVGFLIVVTIGSYALGRSRHGSTVATALSPAPTAIGPTSAPSSATPSAEPVETPKIASLVLPNRLLTPGAVAETSVDVVCHRSTRTVRPPESYTEPLKIEQIREYGYVDVRLGDYEEDHLIPLELGGDPRSPKNLWPEPHYTHPNSFDKDRVENDSHRAVCDGRMSLAHAQSLMASNWVELGRELGDV